MSTRDYRNGKQQARSNVKFLRGIIGMPVEPDAERRFRQSFELQRPGLVAALCRVGPVSRCGCGKDAPFDGGAEGRCECCSTCTTTATGGSA